MNKAKTTYWFLVAIGVIAIISGIYGYFNGQDVWNYGLGIFCGASIIIAVFLNKKEYFREEDKQ
jgi:hypothetical protein